MITSAGKRLPEVVDKAGRRLIVTYRPIAELKLDSKNPHVHAPRQVKQIARSIETFGFVQPAPPRLSHGVRRDERTRVHFLPDPSPASGCRIQYRRRTPLHLHGLAPSVRGPECRRASLCGTQEYLRLGQESHRDGCFLSQSARIHPRLQAWPRNAPQQYTARQIRP